MKNLIIGIDCGVNTGFAIWNVTQQSFEEVSTIQIHRAIIRILHYHEDNRLLKVVVEDARKRKFFGGMGDISARAQGAGSVKRDAKILEDMCNDLNIPIELRKPHNTKVSVAYFESVCKWNKRTSNHSRDAAMMIVGMKK